MSSGDSTSTALPRNSDRPATAIVLLVGLGMLVWTGREVFRSAPLFPFQDERSSWRALLPPLGELSWTSLWSPHNEHRIPLPRLVWYVLYRSTGDLRPGLALQLATLAVVAFSMIALARCLRGGARLADAAFPLLWLNAGNAFNLLSGFQFALTLPTALACAVLVAAAASPGRLHTRRALLAGLALAGLPLCGGVGMTQVPALAAWAAWSGWRSRRSANPAVRAGGRVLLASVLLCAALAAVHLWSYRFGFRPSGRPPLPFSPAMAAALIPVGFGPAAQDLEPASTVLALGLLVATVALLGRAFRRTARERARALGLLASIAATIGLALAIATRRSELDWQSGLPAQYVTLTTPLLCAAFYAWELYGARRSGRLVPALLGLVALGLLPGNTRIGRERFEGVRAKVAEFERTIESGAGPSEILASYARNFRGDPQLDLMILRVLAAEGRPPFDGPRRAVPALEFDFPTFSRAPSRVESPRPVEVRFLRREALTVVAAGSRLHFVLRPGDARIAGRFGAPRGLAGPRASGGVGVRIELRPEEGSARPLLERALRVDAESDPDLEVFSVDLPPGAGGEVVLETDDLAAGEGEPPRSVWCDVRIE